MCDVPWSGTACQYLSFLPAQVGGAYGFDGKFNVTSWGGNSLPVHDNSTGTRTWHGYFTEIGGAHCGLSQWRNQSTVVHATSPNPAGPYTKVSTVIGHEAHNPEVILIKGQYYIFHIGSGNRPEPVHDCDPVQHSAPRAARSVAIAGTATHDMNTTTGSGSGTDGASNVDMDTAAWKFRSGPYACGGDQTCNNCNASHAEAMCAAQAGCQAIMLLTTTNECPEQPTAGSRGVYAACTSVLGPVVGPQVNCFFCPGPDYTCGWNQDSTGKREGFREEQKKDQNNEGDEEEPGTQPGQRQQRVRAQGQVQRQERPRALAPRPLAPRPRPHKKGSCKNFHGVDNCLQIHSASSPAGPFTAVDVVGGPWSPCNNPSPTLHPNGTLFLACAWSMRRASSPYGPWSPSWPIGGAKVGRCWDNKCWEDPYLWFDVRGNWHILAHAYTQSTYPVAGNKISGHGFSKDGIKWHWGEDEPYSNTVQHADGSSKTYSTVERLINRKL